jgi:hypothetical protein
MITLLIGQHQFRVFWQSVFAGIGLLAGASSVGLPSGFVSKKRRLQREVKCGSSEDDLDWTKTLRKVSLPHIRPPGMT